MVAVAGGSMRGRKCSSDGGFHLSIYTKIPIIIIYAEGAVNNGGTKGFCCCPDHRGNAFAKYNQNRRQRSYKLSIMQKKCF